MEFLNKILDWILKNKKKTIFYAFLFFIVPIVLVQVAYSFPTYIPHFNSPLSAGDLLDFYSAFFTTLGTIFLGLVAVRQNQIINKQSIEFQERDEERQIKAVQPYVKCIKVELFPEKIKLKLLMKTNQKMMHTR